MLHLLQGEKGARDRLYAAFAERVRSDEAAILLVPEQFTVHAEERLLAEGIRGLGGASEVLSFKRLERRILISCARPYDRRPDKAARAVFMARAFYETQPSLQIFASAALTPGLIRELLELDEELSRLMCPPERLEEATADDAAPLARRIGELAAILGAYRARLDEANLGGEVGEEARALLRGQNVLEGIPLFADGFYSFAPSEYALLQALLRCSDLTVALPSPRAAEGREALCAKSARTREKLCRAAERAGAEILCEEVAEPETEPALSYLKNRLFERSAPPFSGSREAVSLRLCGDVYDEAEACAAKIRALLREGLRFGDMAVICRRESDYRNVVATVFAEHGIPVFSDQRTPLTAMPLPLYVQTALAIARGEFDSEDVMTHLKTGLTPLSPAEIAALERYCAVWPVQSWQWTRDLTDNPEGFAPRTEQTEQNLAALNAARRLVMDPIEPLKKGLRGTVEDACRALYEYLCATGVPERLEAEAARLDAANESAGAQETVQSWQMLCRAMDALCTAAGDAPASPERFASLWETALSAFDLGRIPTAVDQVLFGDAEHLRSLPRRCVFLLGLNEGVFPAADPGQGLLGDAERDYLTRAGLDLDETAFERAQDEWFLFWNALSLCEERLFLSRPQIAGQKEEQQPSLFFEAVREALGFETIESDPPAPEDRAAGFRELVRGGLRDEELLHYFEEIPAYAAAISRIRRAQTIGKEDRAVSQKMSRLAQADGLSFSPTRLETLNSCRFRHFCRYTLHLKPLPSGKMQANTAGSFVHEMLEKILSSCTGEGQTPPWKEDRETVLARLDEQIDRYLTEKMGYAERSARFRYLASRLREVLRDLVDRLCREFAESAFAPVDCELRVGRDGEIEPCELTFPGGKLRLEGTVDRVDAFTRGGETYLRVVDYKTGAKKLSEDDLYNGENLQMLIYLLSLLTHGQKRYGLSLHPAGVLYYPAQMAIADVEDGKPLDPQKLEKTRLDAERPSGLLIDDPAVLAAMGSYPGTGGAPRKSEEDFSVLFRQVEAVAAELCEELIAGEVTPNPLEEKVCQFCDYADICAHERKGRFSRRKSKQEIHSLKEEAKDRAGAETSAI